MHPSVTALITSGRAQLAPMLGTTDIPFRRLCREYGAGLLTTEMVSATGVLAGDSASFKNAAFDASEHPIALQLVAASPSTAAQAVEELLPLRPDAFELNCGCPDDAICAAGAGSALVDDLPRLTAVLAAMVAASPVPVAAKVRALGRAASRSHASAAASVARAVEDAGAAWITVHARARGVDYGPVVKIRCLLPGTNRGEL